MIRFISFFIFLLIPILFLLFVKRHNKKHIIFPHFLFKQNQKKIVNAILLKILHLFNDILFDILIALLIAIILAQLILPVLFPKNAVCIDGSYSMIMGDYENRTINKVIEHYINNKENYGNHDLFILSFDPQKGKSFLKKINEFKKIKKYNAFLSQLLATCVFHNISYENLSQLYTSRYQKLIFLTDDFPYQDTNIEIQNFGRLSNIFFYPIGIDDSILFGNKKLIVYSSEELTAFRILYYKNSQFELLDNDKYKVNYLSDRYYQIEFSDYGLYAIDTQDLSYIIPCFKPNVEIKATGIYSELFKSVWNDYLTNGATNISRKSVEFQDISEPEILDKIKSKQRMKIKSIFGDNNIDNKLYTISLDQNSNTNSYLHSFYYTLNNPIITYSNDALLNAFVSSEFNNTGYPVFIVQERLYNKYLPVFYYSKAILHHISYYNDFISTENIDSLNYFKKFGTSYLYGSFPDNYKIININAEELFPRRKSKLIFNKKNSYVGLILIIVSVYILKVLVLLFINPIKMRNSLFVTIQN